MEAQNTLSKRSISLSNSQTLVMSQRSRDMQEQGIDVINLSIGEPDFNTPDHIKEAAKKAIDDNITHYTPVPGFKDLRQAIVNKFKNENNIDYSIDEIIVSNGAKHSIANVILSIINPDDEVIIPVPYWVSYSEIIKIAEGTPVYIKASIENDFKITPEQIEKAITPKTKAIFFNSPSNPTGSVYSKSELEAIAKVISKHKNIWILADEIYEHIIFEGEHISLASFDFIKDQVITINGVSKGYAMTGWRIGYIGAPKYIVKACNKIQGQCTSGANSIAQKAALAALSGDNSFAVEMKAEFLKRRNIILELLSQIKGLKLNKPSGAFYVFPDVTYFYGKSFENTKINNASDLCMYILDQAHVAIVTGEAFGEPDCVRFSYATSENQIRKAISRIKIALEKLV